MDLKSYCRNVFHYRKIVAENQLLRDSYLVTVLPEYLNTLIIEPMEYVDILVKEGPLTGEKKVKSEVHRDGDWHRTVHLWIINSKGELLIQKRAVAKESYPNMWDIPSAGHIAAGEDSITSAIRETKEELGLKLDSSEIEYLFTIASKKINNGTFIDNEFSDVYLVRKEINISDIKVQREEVTEVNFVPFIELEKIITQGKKDYVPHPQEYEKLFSELHRRFF